MLLGMEEAAAALNVTPRTLRHWVSTNQAPPSRLIGRRRYFRRCDIETWVNDKFTAPAAN